MFTRWQPFTSFHTELSRMHREMDRLFGTDSNRPSSTNHVFPALNVWQDEEQFVVEAELPGLEMNDLDISINGGNQLTIKGEKKSPVRDGGSWHRRERASGEFGRTIELPAFVDSEKVEATLTHGVLRITLPKPEEAKPRKIAVKAK